MIDLSLARASGPRLRQAGRGLAAAVVLLTLTAGLQAGYAWHLAAPESPVSAPSAPSEPGSDLSLEARRALAAKVAYLNRLLEADAVSWTGILADLEAALPDDAVLTEVRPDGAGRLRLAGQAAAPADVAAFVRRLEAAPAFEGVFLLQQTEAPGATARGVAFTVAFGYRSAR